MSKQILSSLLVLIAVLSSLTASAQSTARGDILSYNDANASAVLDLTSSDLRFNQIPTEGGILSLTINGITREAYLVPAELESEDLTIAIQHTGFDPAIDDIELVLIVGRQGSVLEHLEGQNPLRLFEARVGDELRVNAVAPVPTPQEKTLETVVRLADIQGNLILDLSPNTAARQGLIQGTSGMLTLSGQGRSFLVIGPDAYFTSGPADLYLMPVTLDDGEFLQVTPTPANPQQDIAIEFNLHAGSMLALHYTGYDYGDTAAGHVTDIQDNGQQLITDIAGNYLEQIGAGPGQYVVFSVNGIIRAAMVMDETMFADALGLGGLSSTYVVLQQTDILKIIYMLDDGRTAQGIFNATVGSRVRMRPAQATEAVVREEAVVKAVVEIAPEGFLYADVTPIELSFLQVLVGQYVDVQINGISYRSRVVDEALLAQNPPDDILIFPNHDHTIITHSVGNSITAESRFQASLGDVVIIQRAPN